MRKKMAMLLLVAAIAGLAIPTQALAADSDPCRGYIGGYWLAGGKTVPRIDAPYVGKGMMVPIIDGKKGPFYLDLRDVVGGPSSTTDDGEDDNLFSIWIYQETNGAPGLQRGGHSMVPDVPGVTSGTDPCVESEKPDQDIF